MKRDIDGLENATAQQRVLLTLKTQGPLTAGDLGTLLGVGSVVMRVHLRHLLAAGLVAAERAVDTGGRPARRFRITQAADALFPKHYDVFSLKLVETLLAEVGPAAWQRVLVRWEAALAQHLDGALPVDAKQRLLALVTHQASYGFMASTEEGAHGTEIVERNCPIAHIASRYPEICDHEAAMFSRVLGQPVTLQACQARGAARCVFQVGGAPAPAANQDTAAGVPAKRRKKA